MTWQRLRGDRRMPSRADMTPRAMKGFLKYMTLAQALDGGRNFYFRISGDQVNIQQGMVLQGNTTDDIDARVPGYGAQLARLYARAMRRREVCAYRGLYFRPGDKHTFSHESIMAPLGDDGETPTTSSSSRRKQIRTARQPRIHGLFHPAMPVRANDAGGGRLRDGPLTVHRTGDILNMTKANSGTVLCFV